MTTASKPPATGGHRDTEDRVRRAHLGTVAVTGTVAAVAFAVVLTLSAGHLPDRLATHFTVSGVPDQFTATPWAVALSALLGVGLPALLCTVFLAIRWWQGAQARLLSGLLVGLVVGLPGLFSAQIWAHRGVADAADVRFGLLPGLVVLGIAFAVASVAAVSLPAPPPAPEPAAVTPTRLEEWERATWFGQAQLRGWATVLLAFGVLGMILAALVSGLWWMWLLVPLLVTVMLSVASFSVVVGPDGVRWRAAMGFPRGHIPLSEVTGAGVVQVRFGDFGGMGYRVRPGAVGLITRRGSALQVEHGDRVLVATVTDPVGAASLLLGLLESADR